MRPGSQCGHGVTEDFWVWSQGHRRIFGVVTGVTEDFLGWVPKSPKDFWCGHGVTKIFSTIAWGHGAVLESKNFARTSNGAASA